MTCKGKLLGSLLCAVNETLLPLSDPARTSQILTMLFSSTTTQQKAKLDPHATQDCESGHRLITRRGKMFQEETQSLSSLFGEKKKKNAEKHVHNPNPKIPRMNETIVFQTLIHRERDQTLEILQVRQICWELCATRGIAVKTQGDISLLKVVLQFFVAQNHILSAWHGSQDTWQPSSNLATTFMNSSGLTAPSLSHSPPWSHLISFPSPNTLYFFIFSCPCWGLYWDCFPIFSHDQTSTFDSNAAQMSPFPPISCCVLAIYSHT